MVKKETLAELIVKVTGDTAQAEKSFASLAKAVGRGFGRNIQRVGNIALGGIAAGAATAAAAVGGLGAALAKVTIDAAPIQGVQMAFEGLAQASGKNASDVLRAFDVATGGMVAQRDVMTTYNKAAQLVSIDFANTLPQAMGYLGKVAAATGQDMGFLMDSMVTGVGRLSPMILDNLSVQVDLTQAYEDFASANGLVVGELTKQEQQMAVTEQVMAKLAANTASMPDVANSAAGGLAQLSAFMQNTADAAGMSLLPALQQVVPIVLGFGQSIAAAVLPAIESVGGALATFVEGLRAGVDPLTALKVALFGAFGEQGLALVANIEQIIGQIQAFVGQVWAAVQPLVQFIANNVELNDVLLALGIAISAVVIPALLPIIGTALAIGAAFTALVGIIAALRTAWETNFLGIRDAILGFMEQAKPVFEELIAWLSENIPVAIQTLSDFWSNTLQPALSAVWEFMSTSLLPLLQAINDVLEASMAKALEALAALWQNVLLPALQEAGSYIKDTFTPTAETLSSVIDALKGAFEGVGTAIQNATGWLRGLSDDIAGLTLPKWLTPGSPTPFEIGLIGIGDALKKLTQVDFPALDSELKMGARNEDFSTAGLSNRLVNDLGGSQRETIINQYFTLNSQTVASQSTVDRDFQTMQAMASIA